MHVDPKICFIVSFYFSLPGVEDLLAGNDGNESLDRRSVYYCFTLCCTHIHIYMTRSETQLLAWRMILL